VSKHATTAERYWTTYLPSRVEAVADPDALWDDLSRQVETMVSASLPAAQEAVKAENPDVTYPDLAGMLRAAHDALEQDALREIVFLPPEPGTEDKRMPGTVLPGWE